MKTSFKEKFFITTWYMMFLLLVSFVTAVWAADTKVSALTADASPDVADLLLTVDDPGGTPANKKATIGNVLAAGASLSSIGDLEDAPTAFADQDATPDVSAGSLFITQNSLATTITDFDTDKANGKLIWIIFNDAVTTIEIGTNIEGDGSTDDYEASNGDFANCAYTTTDSKWHCVFFHSTISGRKIIFPSAPTSDDTWAGPETTFLAGEALSQWELVYVTHDTGTPEVKLWDADDGAIQDYEIFGIALEDIADTATGRIGIIGGTARNDGWTFTDNQDEGKTVYGSDTPGAITLTAPSTSTDIVQKVGIVMDEDEILFNFGGARVEVK